MEIRPLAGSGVHAAAALTRRRDRARHWLDLDRGAQPYSPGSLRVKASVRFRLMTNPVPPAQRSGSPALGVPSRTRYLVVVFAIILAIIQYIDRVAISQAAPLISKDLGLRQGTDGLGVRGVHDGLRRVRDPDRLLGRQAWAPAGS